jgi:hypothetical protein
MLTEIEAPAPAHDTDAWKLFVFRKSREALSTQRLLAELRADVQSVRGKSASLLDTLVRAGEIETGLADLASPAAATIAGVVDHLAAVACGYLEFDQSRLECLDQISFPAEIRCSNPEGFSYYGLNPLDFADLARRMVPELRSTIAVIGIRSVGSTLGAVVSATFRGLGMRAERITVRPEGEPYHRKTRFNPEQENWVRAVIEKEGDFVVVDEGPGFSGSTFLSVARALEDLRVPSSRIVLMGSRPFATRSRDETAVADWNRFRRQTIRYAAHTPAGSAQHLSDGGWRDLVYADPTKWPACWVEQERIKILSADRQRLFKFEGFGRFGHLVRQQAKLLAEEKFSPRTLGHEQGYLALEFVGGRPLTTRDLSRDLLARMAAYCAFRVRSFPASSGDVSLLRSMAQVNLEVEFGNGHRDLDFEIPVEYPVYPDCRMLPHEWVLASDGRVLKTDAVGHGDGHQLPGPTDIAWDLAGTIIEWKLTPSETELFLEEYLRCSGDDPAPRLSPYLLLYSVLRTAQCRMAAASLAQQRDGRYLYQQYLAYSQKSRALLDGAVVSI